MMKPLLGAIFVGTLVATFFLAPAPKPASRSVACCEPLPAVAERPAYGAVNGK